MGLGGGLSSWDERDSYVVSVRSVGEVPSSVEFNVEQLHVGWGAVVRASIIIVLEALGEWEVGTSMRALGGGCQPEMPLGREENCFAGGGWHGSPFAQPPPSPPWSLCREGGLGWRCPTCRAGGGGGGSDPNIQGSK